MIKGLLMERVMWLTFLLVVSFPVCNPPMVILKQWSGCVSPMPEIHT